MSTQLIPFQFESHEIRVASDEQGAVWFVAKDVADALDVAWRGIETLSSIKAEWQGVRKFRTPGGEQELIVILEQAVYKLAFRSRKPEAERFSDWAADVIASIRKTGTYTLPHTKPKLTREERYRLGVYRDAVKTAQLIGFVGNMALLSADNYCKQTLGCSVLENLGATHLLADERGKTYTQTEIGKMLNPPLSPIKTGLLMEVNGLQTREMGVWMPTDAAQGLFEWLDTGKRHSNGTPVKQIKWFKDVLEKLMPAVTRSPCNEL